MVRLGEGGGHDGEHPPVPHGDVQRLAEHVQLRAKSKEEEGVLENGEAPVRAVTRRELVVPDVPLHHTCHREIGCVRPTNLQAIVGSGRQGEVGRDSVRGGGESGKMGAKWRSKEL